MERPQHLQAVARRREEAPEAAPAEDAAQALAPAPSKAAPEMRVPTIDERIVSRDVLLPVLRRGLAPILDEVEAMGKTVGQKFAWSPKAAFEKAVSDYVDEFILPELRKLEFQAPPSVRLMQLEAKEALEDRLKEALGAYMRQRDYVNDLYAAATRPTPLLVKTKADQELRVGAAEKVIVADADRKAMVEELRYGDATVYARAAATQAELSAAAYRYPHIGSRVVVQSQRAYLQPEVWEGEVVRHARSQNAFVVKLANGAVRMATPIESGGNDRVVEQTARGHW